RYSPVIVFCRDTDDAFVLDQVSITESPDVIDETEILSVQVGGGGGVDATVTCAVQLAVAPPVPVAVPVNVRSAVTVTVVEPPLAGVSVTPSMLKPVALLVFHVSVTVPPPAGSEVGEAVRNVQEGVGVVGGGVTVTVLLQSSSPPAPVTCR
ncbi:MAG TPA: hypothetical protein VF439_01040, partial [Candidatus Paceibacterota bacterium]